MSSRRQIGVSDGGDARNSSAEAYPAGVKPPARSSRPSAFRWLASSSIRTTRGEEVVDISSTATIGRDAGPAHRPLVQSVVYDRWDVQRGSEPQPIDNQ